MPKIFEYLGIDIYFYSNEHQPLHVHAKRGDAECKAEFIIKQGKIVEIRIKAVTNVKMLGNAHLRNFNAFLKSYSDQVVNKWIDFFVLKKKVSFEEITRKLK